eukprot:638193-Rhodomonas_salina.1
MAIQYGTVPADPAAKPSRRPAMLYGAVATAALAVLVVVACLGFMTPKQDAPAELLVRFPPSSTPASCHLVVCQD